AGGARSALRPGRNPDGARERIRFSFKKEENIGYLASVPGLYLPAVPSYASDPTVLNDPVLKQFDPKMVATLNRAAAKSGSTTQEGATWKINPKGATIQSSLGV